MVVNNKMMNFHSFLAKLAKILQKNKTAVVISEAALDNNEIISFIIHLPYRFLLHRL